MVGDWLRNLTPLFNQREAKPKPIALSKLKVIAMNFDWLIALFALVVIGVSPLVAAFRQARKSLHYKHLEIIKPDVSGVCSSSERLTLAQRLKRQLCYIPWVAI